MSVPTHASEMIAWAAFGLALEVCCPSEDSFWVTVRRTESAGVLWDGDVIALGRTLDDLPSVDFTVEARARPPPPRAPPVEGEGCLAFRCRPPGPSPGRRGLTKLPVLAGFPHRRCPLRRRAAGR